MTAPSGLSPDRFRIDQRVEAVREHTAPCFLPRLANYPIRAYVGELGTIGYFWNDGRFVVTWDRNPSTPVSYGPEAWPGTVGPAPVDSAAAPPPAPDARSENWEKQIDDWFLGQPSGGP